MRIRRIGSMDSRATPNANLKKYTKDHGKWLIVLA